MLAGPVDQGADGREQLRPDPVHLRVQLAGRLQERQVALLALMRGGGEELQQRRAGVRRAEQPFADRAERARSGPGRWRRSGRPWSGSGGTPCPCRRPPGGRCRRPRRPGRARRTRRRPPPAAARGCARRRRAAGGRGHRHDNKLTARSVYASFSRPEHDRAVRFWRSSMKAVVATGYGPPEQYTVAEVPVPRPGPGQIQVADRRRLDQPGRRPAAQRRFPRRRDAGSFRTCPATTSPARSARSAPA